MAQHRADRSRSRGASATRRTMVAAAGAAMTLSLIGVAPGVSAAAAPRETVAAIDPSLTAGRGATLGFVEQEAENGSPSS